MINFLWDNLPLKNKEKKDLAKFLKEIHLFNHLSPLELHFLKDFIHSRQYQAGEFIFKQGEAGVGMYIIYSGNIDITIDKPSDDQKGIQITRLKVGDFMGEIALVEENGRRTATAQAVDKTMVLGFFQSDLIEITKRRPVIGVKIYSRLAETLGARLKETAKHVTELKRNFKELREIKKT